MKPFNVAINVAAETVYLVGQVNRDIPFLCKTTKGTLSTPFFVEENGVISAANAGGNYTITDAKLQEIPKNPVPYPLTVRDLKLLSIAVNDVSGVKFYPIVAYGDDAVYLHTAIHKGDTLVFLGQICPMRIPGTSQTIDMVWAKDIRLLRQSNATKLKLAVDPESVC